MKSAIKTPQIHLKFAFDQNFRLLRRKFQLKTRTFNQKSVPGTFIENSPLRYRYLILNLVMVKVVLWGGRVDEVGELPVWKLEAEEGEEGVEEAEPGLLLHQLHQESAHKLKAHPPLRVLRLLLLLQIKAGE